MTPPNSPTKETVLSEAVVKDLKHLFDVLLQKMLDSTDRRPQNTPVSQDQSSLGLEQVRQVLDSVSAKLSEATRLAPSSLARDEREEAPSPDKVDLTHAICTTPEDFQSFEKWASPQFKTVVETYEPPNILSIPFQKLTGMGVAGTRKHANTRSQSR